MPKHMIEGTQTAVNSPSSLCPENQRKPETAKEILTARRMKKSACLTMFCYSNSKDPSAAIIQPSTDTPARDRTPECPATSNSENSRKPIMHPAVSAKPVAISKMPSRTASVLAKLSKVSFKSTWVKRVNQVFGSYAFICDSKKLGG